MTALLQTRTQGPKITKGAFDNIVRILGQDYTKVLLQISCLVIFGLLNATYIAIFYFKQIYRHCNAMNIKTNDF